MKNHIVGILFSDDPVYHVNKELRRLSLLLGWLLQLMTLRPESLKYIAPGPNMLEL